MCGRFSAISETDVLKKRFKTKRKSLEIHKQKKLKKKYNIAPRDYARVILPTREIEVMRWGLIPHFASDEHFAHKLINARSETLHEKKSFTDLYIKGSRCLIPSEGFYEFPKGEQGKQAWRLCLKNEDLFAYAGLYSSWIHPENGDKLLSFTILTTSPNKLIQPDKGPAIHDRMPVILTQQQEDLWLHPSSSQEQLMTCFHPFPADAMKAIQLDSYIRNAKHEGQNCWKTKPDDSDPFGWLSGSEPS